MLPRGRGYEVSDGIRRIFALRTRSHVEEIFVADGKG